MILGVLFILIGISIIAKMVFRIDLPIVRIAFALFLLYAGVKMLIGSFTPKSDHIGSHSVLFSESSSKAENVPGGNHYNVVFGKMTVDLRHLAPGQDTGKPVEDVHAEINTVFGETIVLLKPNQPVVIHSNAAFGEAKMPDNNMVAFGTMNYQSPEAAGAKAKLIIQGNVVFGALRFEIAPL